MEFLYCVCFAISWCLSFLFCSSLTTISWISIVISIVLSLFISACCYGCTQTIIQEVKIIENSKVLPLATETIV